METKKDETRENPRPHAVRHYTAKEIAQMWNLSADTVIRIFESEPGVIVLSERRKGSISRRQYRTLRIPEPKGVSSWIVPMAFPTSRSQLDGTGKARQAFTHSGIQLEYRYEQTGNLKLAQKFLGHSTINMTADIYTHTSAEAERDAAIALERAIYGDLFPVVPNIENRNNFAALN